MQTKKTTSIGWIARIICIAAILFVSLFALDSFQDGDSILEKASAFGMHMIPSFVLLMVLLLAWKFELAGGILFMLIGIGMAWPIFNLNYDRTQSVSACLMVLSLINLPFVIVGLLFLFSHFKLKKQSVI